MLEYEKYVFSLQAVQFGEAMRAPRMDPTGHTVQLDAPDAFAKVPAAQGCAESREEGTK